MLFGCSPQTIDGWAHPLYSISYFENRMKQIRTRTEWLHTRLSRVYTRATCNRKCIWCILTAVSSLRYCCIFYISIASIHDAHQTTKRVFGIFVKLHACDHVFWSRNKIVNKSRQIYLCSFLCAQHQRSASQQLWNAFLALSGIFKFIAYCLDKKFIMSVTFSLKNSSKSYDAHFLVNIKFSSSSLKKASELKRNIYARRIMAGHWIRNWSHHFKWMNQRYNSSEINAIYHDHVKSNRCDHLSQIEWFH